MALLVNTFLLLRIAVHADTVALSAMTAVLVFAGLALLQFAGLRCRQLRETMAIVTVCPSQVAAVAAACCIVTLIAFCKIVFGDDLGAGHAAKGCRNRGARIPG